MTEAEAKTKWCPAARARAFASEAAINRPFHAEHDSSIADDECACIASACMAWRWVRDGEYRIVADAEFRRTGRHKQPTNGYCGLAGAPS